ncbi:TIGR04168 family protein [Aphanothece hegewaldii CCALA 016]|uniref:TIGR04168 family protein n=1 Tax=Aphanothece hegewaldii CCALA 016 TaxID=2107694 RepID=A0A2T1LS31_9CHRO|nr:TIGR04168 family protein [Aphanothece hegewaldii]PSF32241.1 TIGR04168 family protein [Aphanothece hegewaldii CCALA 016]
MTIQSKDQIKIAVVGDIHEQWEEQDNLTLKHLGVDLVLFVGDFGNESMGVVRRIASSDLPKAAIMGNHDAWYSATSWGRKQSPYDHDKEDWVQEQLNLLGEAHVGYGKLDFPEFQLSIVGSRPFSWGGSDWKNKTFLQTRYGVNNFTESTAKIMEQVEKTAFDTLIFLGHNGPFGLGELAEDICGKDWQPIGGDHGDPDFTEAIALSRQMGKTIPLVTFGHMHHRLRHTQTRLRTQIEISPENTIYLNAALVPRIIEQNGQKLRNFSLVTLEQKKVTQASLVWIDPEYQIVSENLIYSTKENLIEAV